MKNWKTLTGVLLIGFLLTSIAQADSGEEAVFASDAYSVDLFNTVKLSGSRFITVYNEWTTDSKDDCRLKAVVGTVNSDLSVTYGQTIIIDSECVRNAGATSIADSQFVVAFTKGTSDSSYFYMGSITGSGSNATFGQGKSSYLNIGHVHNSVYSISSTQWLYLTDTFHINAGYTHLLYIATMEADSFRLGKGINISPVVGSDDAVRLDLAPLSSSKFILLKRYPETSNSVHNFVVAGTIVTEDSVSFGTPNTYCYNTSDTYCEESDIIALSDDAFVVAYSIDEDSKKASQVNSLPFLKMEGKSSGDSELYGAVKAGAVTGNSINLGDEYKFWEYEIEELSVSKINESRFTVVFNDVGYGHIDYVRAIALPGNVNGTTVNWDGKFFCSGSDFPNGQLSTVFNENKLLTTYNYQEFEGLTEVVEFGACTVSSLGDMNYTSSAAVQETKVLRGFENQAVLKINVEMDGSYNPLHATSFQFNISGTSDAADVSNAKLWYSEFSASFENLQQFGDSVTALSGNFTFTDDVQLSGGTNYFWLTFDIEENASLGNLADAECLSITIGGSPQTPSPTAPTGGAVISMPRMFRASNAEYPSINGLYMQSGKANGNNYYVNSETDTTHYLYYLSMNNMEFWFIGVSLESNYFRLLNWNQSSADFSDPPESGWTFELYTGPSNLTITEVFENTLSYSGTVFYESAANDGSIDNSTPVTVTYSLPRNGNSFSGSFGDDFVSANQVTVDNLPTGLTALVTRQTDTTATITMTGNATNHENSDNVYDLKFTFTDDAFSLGQAAQVYNSIMDSLCINFQLKYYVYGAGSQDYNGIYSGSGMHNGKTKYEKDASHVIYYTTIDDLPYWIMADVVDAADYYYYIQTDADTLPRTSWSTKLGDAPAPTVIKADLPVLTTSTPANITVGSATCGGVLVSSGGTTVTERGICWGTSENPTLDDSSMVIATTSDTFSVSLEGLSSNTNYHVRAYAKNEMGAGYGNDVAFKTEQINIWVTPADTLLRGNQSFTYAVHVANVYPGMRGYEVKISLNASAFSSIEFTEGTFLSSTSESTHWELLGDSGEYTVNCAILGVTNGKTGDGTLFTIAVTTDMPVPDNLVSTVGNNFLLNSVKFRDVNNLAISVDSTMHGKIVVDTGRPTMETISETQEVWYRNVPKFSNFGFDDNYNLDRVEYKIDYNDWVTIADDINSTQYNNDGWELPGFDTLDEQTALHTIHWRAHDDAGNYDGYHEVKNDALTSSEKKSGKFTEALKPDLNFWKWTFKKDDAIPQGVLAIEITNITTTSMHVNAASVVDATQGDEYYQFECTTDGNFNRSRAIDDSVHECTGLTPNHIYEFKYRVSDGVNDPNSTPAYNQSDWSPVSSKHTLSVPPSTSNLTCERSGDKATTTLTLTAVGGFGEGTLEYYRYALVNSDTYTWTGQEEKWDEGTLQLGIPTPDTDYYVFVKGYNGDDVANGTLRFGPYRWDGTPIKPVADLEFGTSVDSTNGFNLNWTNPDLDAFYIEVWIIGYGGYPEYTGQVPEMPANPEEALAAGWTKIFEGLVTSLDYRPDLRDFYYCAVFVEDLAHHFSPAVLDSSLSYWLGDVDPDGDVDAADIAILAAAYFTMNSNNSWNNICDVGPTLNRSRNSRPCPDNVIDFEDLMIFAMNYENTGGGQAKKKTALPKTLAPISLNMSLTRQGGSLTAEVQLAENSGAIKGLSIPVSFGAGLLLESVEKGNIWNETDFFLSNSEANSLNIDGAVLGNSDVIEGNGSIAVLTFSITGENTDVQFGDATARSSDNSDIEIGYSYTAITLEAKNEIPTEYRLHQNYPNPFNPTTTIRYDLKERGHVKISLYNVNGQKMDTIFEGMNDAGYHSLIFKADNLTSGVYLYRIEVNNYSEMHKMILVK